LKNEEKNIKIAQFLKNAFLAVKLQSTKLEKRLSKGGAFAWNCPCVELSLRGIAQFLKNAFLAVKLQSTKLEKRLSKGGVFAGADGWKLLELLKF